MLTGVGLLFSGVSILAVADSADTLSISASFCSCCCAGLSSCVTISSSPSSSSRTLRFLALPFDAAFALTAAVSDFLPRAAFFVSSAADSAAIAAFSSFFSSTGGTRAAACSALSLARVRLD